MTLLGTTTLATQTLASHIDHANTAHKLQLETTQANKIALSNTINLADHARIQLEWMNETGAVVKERFDEMERNRSAWLAWSDELSRTSWSWKAAVWMITTIGRGM